MKRIMMLAVILMAMTAAFAQKQTNYKFKFKVIMDANSGKTVPCDFEFEIIDLPGEAPAINLKNNSARQNSGDELSRVIVYNTKTGMICFVSAKGSALYGITITADNDGRQACSFVYYESTNNETKMQFGLTNDPGSSNNEQNIRAFKVLLENVKTSAFNNFTVETM